MSLLLIVYEQMSLLVNMDIKKRHYEQKSLSTNVPIGKREFEQISLYTICQQGLKITVLTTNFPTETFNSFAKLTNIS